MHPISTSGTRIWKPRVVMMPALSSLRVSYTDSKVHGANMGPIWGRQDPGGPRVGPMNLANWVGLQVGNMTTLTICGMTNLASSQLTTYAAAHNNKVVIMTTLGLHCHTSRYPSEYRTSWALTGRVCTGMPDKSRTFRPRTCDIFIRSFLKS